MSRFKSISTRLSVYVTTSVLIMFGFIVGLLLLVQYILLHFMMQMSTSWHVDSLANTVEKRLAEVQSTIWAHDIKVTGCLDSPRELSMILQDMLYNTSIYGCGIAIKPDSTGHRYLLYAYRNEDNEVVVEQRPTDYAYEERNYYVEAEQRMSDYWSDPYHDSRAAMSTFSHPLMNHRGEFMGVLCADVLLDSIAGYVQAGPGTSNATILTAFVNIVFEGSIPFMLSSNGFFILPPDSTVNYEDTYMTYAIRHETPEFGQIGKSMVTRQEYSNDEFELDGTEYRLGYSYINQIGWTVAVLYPTNISNILNILFDISILVLVIIGIIILVIVINYVVRKSTKPLTQFVHATESIARGDFDIELPNDNRHDEIQVLRDSFDEMRVSLKDYVKQLKDSTAQNERMEQDLNIASQIQTSMLPKQFPCPPEVPELSMYAYMKPTREIGGDLYDFFIRAGHLHFITGDVSGKGIPAAMIMAVINSMFRALQHRDMGPERSVKALNNMLIERSTSDMFATLIVGDLNLATGDLSLCNAGHNPPILMQNGGQQYVQLKRNIPIGVFQNYHYQSDHLKMAPDARLLLYTDGVTEAYNSEDCMYGEDRLMATSMKNMRNDIESFVKSIISDLSTFTGDTPQSDDMTMMMIEYHGTQNVVALELHFTNDIQEVGRISDIIEQVCEQLNVDCAICASLQLAVEEAVVNVINYAYENGRANIDNLLKITSDGTTITFTLSDSGRPFDPTKAKMPDTTLAIEERGVGGLGILLVHKIMDEVKYQRLNNRNILTMTKKI